MKKPHFKFTTMVILAITGLLILASFINLVGISGTLKYFLVYFIILLAFFGISLWLKRDWICYIPSYFLIFLAPVSILLEVIFNTGGDPIGQFIIIIFVVVAIILSGISFLIARLFIIYVIKNKELNLFKELVQNSDVIVVSIGVIIWVRLVADLFRNSQDLAIFLIVIVLYSFLFFLGSVILTLILYAYDLIGKITSYLSLFMFLIYYPFTLLIQSERTNFFVILGFSIWLIFGTLLMMGLRKIRARRSINSHEEGEIYD